MPAQVARLLEDYSVVRQVGLQVLQAQAEVFLVLLVRVLL
jgi:hypothetical protein